MPGDIDIMGVYLPPLLVSTVLGIILASLTAHLLNKRGLSAKFSNLPLVFVGLVVIYSLLLGSTVFPT